MPNPTDDLKRETQGGEERGRFAPAETPAPLIPAAMYVRMSTEHQQYSTENQAEAIRQYAEKHGFKIVEVFEDSGKSGLNIEGRESLKRMLDMVESGTAAFKAILAYDISR